VAGALGDEERVLQIGHVVVENAIVHTPPGTRVVVSAGPGIAAVAQPHVFDRFYRLEGARAGSGLGLAIARELAALMGGRIELESGTGATRFTLVLPADVLDRAQEPALAQALSE
jgi:two-component system OmpR family sensor kinase